MSDRVILAVKYTPAAAAGQVRKAVGGFLRYVQHRDLHPTQADARLRPDVSGLLKYVAYRDRASTRAELFGPAGTLSSEDRKAFAAFVATSLERSSPQQFRGRDGNLHDRRRAVYRFVISPERAEGLDLRQLTSAAVGRLERESAITGLRWIAAIHRNTAHHHVHLVVAGMCQNAAGNFHRVDITKSRLAAMKETLALEILRQRGERQPSPTALPQTRTAMGGRLQSPALKPPAPPALIPIPPIARPVSLRSKHVAPYHSRLSWSVLQLRAAARKYQRDCERDAEEESRRRQWQLVA